MCTALAKRGFNVLEASDGESALALFHVNESGIDLVISDLVMAGMDGPALVREMLVTRPNLLVLFISGYFSSYRAAMSGFPCLPKPFLISEVVQRAGALLTAGGRERPRAVQKHRAAERV
jgi:two-component system cell cycle sensor histidine kinase/response regulator CckA